MDERDADGKSGKTETPAPFKRRSFLATRQDEALEAETLRIRTGVVDALQSRIPSKKKDDDIPVLTEVVPAGGEERAMEVMEAMEEIWKASPDLPASLKAELEELTQRMIEAIERQLTYELPTLIEASLLSISADLRNGITSTMQAALRDFAARYKRQ
jgi:hypothetical protein